MLTNYFVLGNRDFEREDYTAALENYERAIELHPRQTQAYYNHGLTAIKLQQYQRALNSFIKTIELDPYSTYAHLQRGLVYIELQAYDRAISTLFIALNQAKQQKNLDLFNRAKEALAKARKLYHLKRSNKFIDGCKIALCVVVWTVSGISFSPSSASYSSKAQYSHQPELTPEDAEYYDRAIKQHPNDANAYYNRGAIYYLQGEHQQAIAYFDRALEIDANHTDAYYSRGTSYFELGEYLQAAQDLDRALEINPQDAEAHVNRGMVYCRQGQYQQAIEHFT